MQASEAQQNLQPLWRVQHYGMSTCFQKQQSCNDICTPPVINTLEDVYPEIMRSYMTTNKKLQASVASIWKDFASHC